MTPVEVIRQAEGMKLQDRKGRVRELTLLPPLTDEELRELEAQLPCSLPQEARELFAFCRGIQTVFEDEFTDIVAEINFTDIEGAQYLETILPHSFPLVSDGTGSAWEVDLVRDSATWAPIYYVCHDPPVVLYQTDSLAHFLIELLKLGNPPWESELAYVYEDEGNVYLDNPGMLTQEQGLASGDADLVAFAQALDETWLIKDLRRPKLGDGFTWGRYSADLDTLRRFGEQRIFAYQQRPRKSLWQRVLGR